MRLWSSLLLAATFIISGSLITSVLADKAAEPAAPAAGVTAEEAKEGYVSLFDGKTLDGWQGAVKGYKAEDGIITCIKGSGGNLYTKKEYSDFVLRFDFKLTAGANNGLGIRAPLQGDAAYVGMELQILDDSHPKYAKLKEYQYHGSIYGVAAAKRGHQKPVGEWNSQEVHVKGSQVKVILNGTTILDVDVAKVSQPKTVDGQKHPGLERKTGYVGFLGHGDELFFRNLRIKEIK